MSAIDICLQNTVVNRQEDCILIHREINYNHVWNIDGKPEDVLAPNFRYLD